jgi:hypothetical protein
MLLKKPSKISGRESLSYCELKHYEAWFDEKCSELVDCGKQAKLHWLQDPNELNEDNMSNVILEASRHFRNKKREYLRDKINVLESDSKNKNIRDLCRDMN